MSTTVSNTNSSQTTNTLYDYSVENRIDSKENMIQNESQKDTLNRQVTHHPKAKKGEDGKYHFKEAPPKANDNSPFKPTPDQRAKDNQNVNSSSNQSTGSTQSSNNNEYLSKSGAELLTAFRNGDEKLLKALNENPALMQKLIDQMHTEERNIELISNYNKSKDDALKTIIHNMK